MTGDVRLLEEEDIPSPSWMIWTFVVDDASRCGMTTMLESSLQTIGKKMNPIFPRRTNSHSNAGKISLRI